MEVIRNGSYVVNFGISLFLFLLESLFVTLQIFVEEFPCIREASLQENLTRVFAGQNSSKNIPSKFINMFENQRLEQPNSSNRIRGVLDSRGILPSCEHTQEAVSFQVKHVQLRKIDKLTDLTDLTFAFVGKLRFGSPPPFQSSWCARWRCHSVQAYSLPNALQSGFDMAQHWNWNC